MTLLCLGLLSYGYVPMTLGQLVELKLNAARASRDEIRKPRAPN